MAKENEQLEAQQAAAQAAAASETPNYNTWRKNMRSKYGEDKTDEELYALSMSGYDTEHEAAKKYTAEAEDFAMAVKENPAIGEIFAGILDHSLTDENYSEHPELAEYADRKKKKDEEAASQQAQEELNQRRADAFEAVCEEDNIADPEGALAAIQEVLNNPCETIEQCKDQVRAFLRMVNYDADIEAARVQERNANIVTKRKKNAGASDGLVNRGSAAAGSQNNEGKNPLARMASRGAAARNL